MVLRLSVVVGVKLVSLLAVENEVEPRIGKLTGRDVSFSFKHLWWSERDIMLSPTTKFANLKRSLGKSSWERSWSTVFLSEEGLG